MRVVFQLDESQTSLKNPRTRDIRGIQAALESRMPRIRGVRVYFARMFVCRQNERLLAVYKPIETLNLNKGGLTNATRLWSLLYACAEPYQAAAAVTVFPALWSLISIAVLMRGFFDCPLGDSSPQPVRNPPTARVEAPSITKICSTIKNFERLVSQETFVPRGWGSHENLASNKLEGVKFRP